eukprot:Sspe_Gene.53306::Locus_29491_Transcript_1_1_Confidence_1.000_Length_629::g.53306::m.53306
MMTVLFLLSAVIGLCAGQFTGVCPPASQTFGTLGVEWTIGTTMSQPAVQFKLTIPMGSDYGAIGFGKAMAGSDIYAAYFDAMGSPVVKDMFSQARLPEDDPTQDVMEISGDSMARTITFVRLLNTADTKDFDLSSAPSTVDMIWAIGAVSGGTIRKHTVKGAVQATIEKCTPAPAMPTPQPPSPSNFNPNTACMPQT